MREGESRQKAGREEVREWVGEKMSKGGIDRLGERVRLKKRAERMWERKRRRGRGWKGRSK